MWIRDIQHFALRIILGAAFGISASAQAPPAAVDLHSTVSLDLLVSQLASKRVVFLGEIHDRYDHHLQQLEVTRRLHQIDPAWTIGVEYFQQTFQAQLDDYIEGRSTEEEMLRATHYYQGWGWDYRLYSAIFRFAREQHIPVRALNVPRELAPAVAKSGLEGLSAERRAELPKEMGAGDEDYRRRLRESFEQHGPEKPKAFDHFVEAQLVWDEGMAENAASYLNANPERRMVILAGYGHTAFADGIPQRLQRRTNASYASVVMQGVGIEPSMADFLLFSPEQKLAPAGVLGVGLEEKGEECLIRSVSPGGAGDRAGLEKGDIVTHINGRKIGNIADLKVALWDKKPEERVQVSIRRKRFLFGEEDRDFTIELAAPATQSN